MPARPSERRRTRWSRIERLEPRRVLATLAIDAGGGGVGEYVSDRSFVGGRSFSTGDSINTAGVIDSAPAAVYQTERTGQGGSDFRYDLIGLLPGESYDLRLHFAEIYWTSAGSRSFDVRINGATVLDDYDVFVEAGGADRAVVEEFTATADASGLVRLDFVTEIDNAKLSGIELTGEFPPEPEKPSILFVRGADRSGGFFEFRPGDSENELTEQLADINNFATNGGNHGWGELGQALENAGFAVEQITETAENLSGQGQSQGIHIDFESMDLTEYDAIVFGSNNAVYDTAAVNAIEDYVRGGGSTLFISDANFGSDWADASNSDQQFLDRFGLVMHQDQGTYSLTRSDPADFLVPTHPIFTGVDRIDGEGVTPIRVENPGSFGVEATILARAEGQTRLNNGSGGNNQGSSRSAGPNDATVVVATAGAGKVAGHFDRNTFFNQNGAGTNINRFDNKQYALNLFGWLVGAFDPVPGDYDSNGIVELADRAVWVNAYGTTGLSPADGNGDGSVDAADYTVWRDNLGASRPTLNLAASAATQPASANQLAGLAFAPPTTESSLSSRSETGISVGAVDRALLLLTLDSETPSEPPDLEAQLTDSEAARKPNADEPFELLRATTPLATL